MKPKDRPWETRAECWSDVVMGTLGHAGKFAAHHSSTPSLRPVPHPTPTNPMREKNAHCVKSTAQTPGRRAASTPIHTAFPRISPACLARPPILALWHELGWHSCRDREVVWNRRAKNAEETSVRGQGIGGWGPDFSIEQTALPPDSLSFFVKAGAGGRGIVRGEKPDSSSPFTLLTSLFFDGHECGRACRVMPCRDGTDRT